MFDWLWKRLGGGTRTTPTVDEEMGVVPTTTAGVPEGGVEKAKNGGAKLKEVKAIKAKPTVAKTNKYGSALSAVRTGNTRSNGTGGHTVIHVKTAHTEDGAVLQKNSATKTTFDELYERLVDYKKKHGTCCVPANYKEDLPLASFVTDTRRQYQVMKERENNSTPVSLSGDNDELLSNSSASSLDTRATATEATTSLALTPDQVKQLENIDFDWEGKRATMVAH
jgi:Helicase associated domain